MWLKTISIAEQLSLLPQFYHKNELFFSSIVCLFVRKPNIRVTAWKQPPILHVHILVATPENRKCFCRCLGRCKTNTYRIDNEEEKHIPMAKVKLKSNLVCMVIKQHSHVGEAKSRQKKNTRQRNRMRCLNDHIVVRFAAVHRHSHTFIRLFVIIDTALFACAQFNVWLFQIASECVISFRMTDFVITLTDYYYLLLAISISMGQFDVCSVCHVHRKKKTHSNETFVTKA